MRQNVPALTDINNDNSVHLDTEENNFGYEDFAEMEWDDIATDKRNNV